MILINLDYNKLNYRYIFVRINILFIFFPSILYFLHLDKK